MKTFWSTDEIVKKCTVVSFFLTHPVCTGQFGKLTWRHMYLYRQLKTDISPFGNFVHKLCLTETGVRCYDKNFQWVPQFALEKKSAFF
jgi:hypothetical protein